MTLWIGRLHPITVYETAFACALFWCWVPLCVLFTNSWLACYSIMMVATVDGIYVNCCSFWPTYLDFLKISCFCSATMHLAECFCPWTLSLSIGLDMLTSDFFVSCVDYFWFINFIYMYLRNVMVYQPFTANRHQLFSLSFLTSSIDNGGPWAATRQGRLLIKWTVVCGAEVVIITGTRVHVNKNINRVNKMHMITCYNITKILYNSTYFTTIWFYSLKNI